MNTRVFALLSALVLLTSCAAIREADSADKEQLLAAAGFQIRPANTPKKQAFLQSQEPYKLTRHVRNGNYYYSYANPQTQTLYVGGAAEYARYEQLAVKQNIATQQYWAASQNEMAAAEWSAWGPLVRRDGIWRIDRSSPHLSLI